MDRVRSVMDGQTDGSHFFIPLFSPKTRETINSSIFITEKCSDDQLQCGDGKCLHMSNRCDGTSQCSYNMEEQGCGNMIHLKNASEIIYIYISFQRHRQLFLMYGFYKLILMLIASVCFSFFFFLEFLNDMYVVCTNTNIYGIL